MDGTRRAILTLIAAQFLMQFTYGAAQGLTVLRLLALDSVHAQLLLGLAFAAAGIATIASATTYWRGVARTGFRPFVVVVGLLLVLSVVMLAIVPSAWLLISAIALVNLIFGALNPALSSMLGLEAPDALKGTVFGMSAGATALGMAFGPILAGIVAAQAGINSGLFTGAAAALIGTALVLWWGREPLAGLVQSGSRDRERT
jgi:MFS family permease